MTLHILSCSDKQSETLQSCLDSASAGDVLIMIGDGVYHSANPPLHLNCFALSDDICKRDFKEAMNEVVSLIDYPEFVNLVCQHNPICSWF